MKLTGVLAWLGPALVASATTAVPLTAHAEPITYHAFTIADGVLGSWRFHNARVNLTFESDTNNVQLTQIQTVHVAFNPKGTAHIGVVTDQKTERATFAPSQIFVSLDQDNSGVGFGSMTPSGGMEVAYPLGIEDGTIDSADAPIVSPELAALSMDLMHDTGFSGRGWICVGFPNRTCPTPTTALKTDKGDLFLFQRYQEIQSLDVLNGGLFFAVTGSGSDDDND